MSRKWMPHGITAWVLVVFIVLGQACATAPKAPDTPKGVEVVYTEIPFSELSQSIQNVNSPGQGFIVEVYNIVWGRNAFGFSGTPDGTPSGWVTIHDGGYNDRKYYTYFEPRQFETYNDQTYKRIDETKKYRIYLGVYQNSYSKNWVLFIDKIEGLMSITEVAAIEAKQKAEAEAKAAEAEARAAQAKADRQKALDEKAKSLVRGYTYHGAAENTQSSKLFDGGALEEGHAYYISAFMIGGGGLMGGVITSLFANPTYHVVEYASQKVKGEVVGTSQSLFGTLPVSVIIAGGKPPLRIPIILGLLE
jgi:hypothetical protein